MVDEELVDHAVDLVGGDARSDGLAGELQRPGRDLPGVPHQLDRLGRLDVAATAARRGRLADVLRTRDVRRHLATRGRCTGDEQRAGRHDPIVRPARSAGRGARGPQPRDGGGDPRQPSSSTASEIVATTANDSGSRPRNPSRSRSPTTTVPASTTAPARSDAGADRTHGVAQAAAAPSANGSAVPSRPSTLSASAWLILPTAANTTTATRSATNARAGIRLGCTTTRVGRPTRRRPAAARPVPPRSLSAGRPTGTAPSSAPRAPRTRRRR